MSIETADDLDWRADAACREYPAEMWFPDGAGPTTAARAVCAACPVKAACLLFSLEIMPEFGIFAGIGPRGRAKLNPRTATRPRPPCGTTNGYRNHYRHGEKPCESCRRAEKLFHAERRANPGTAA